MNLQGADSKPGQSENKMKEAVILAGGLGTRLRDVTGQTPKAMAPVNGKPFLSYVLQMLSQDGFDRIILATGFLSAPIESYYGYSFAMMEIDYSVEKEPLGTGGAILLASKIILSDNFFVLNGDTYFNVDFEGMEDQFSAEKPDVLVALKQMKDFDRYGSVSITNSRIVSFNEKKYCSEGLINGGIYLVNKKWLGGVSPGIKFSVEKDILEKHTESAVLNGFISDGYFIDIGIPEDYNRAIRELK